ncbi:hypothetical protein DD238_000872 [Peronospora effusa]|uniref:Ubiquitin-like protease family profile domain-containing protein n=1 Tax=Peronospora effusa TaxID=542832 RepID=A0A3M6VTE3_9STRA|nr:hypothetical protein DD238_000872 [Peronospora effusa]RQM18476.1 hypothetical protein DD237_001769 [Peronospora effusa]
MRLGLESLSPLHTSTIHRSPSSSSSSSAHSLIAVDDDSADDSADDTEPQFPRVQEPSALFYRPSLLDLYFTNSTNEIGNTGNTGTTQHQRDQQTSDNKSSDILELKPFGHQLNFFFNMKNQSRKRDNSRLRSFNCRSRVSSSSNDELMGIISAARTSICGKTFDRGELKFGQDRVHITIWKDNKPQWQGKVKYTHIVRFCFSRADCPPYILLLQLDNAKSRSDFAAFYDPIFAKVCEENDTKDQAILKLYGIVFYFDEAMDFMRCQSMVGNNPRLAAFFRETLSESEARQYRSLDALRAPRYLLRRGMKDSLCCDTRSHNFEEMMGNGARQELGAVSSSVTSFFRPIARTSVLEKDENPSVVQDHDNFVKGRTLNLLTEVSHPDFEEEKLPISIVNVGTGKHECRTGAEGGETMVITRTPREQFGTQSAIDALTSSLIQQSEMQSENMKRKERAASSWREDERVKRRRIESRRNEKLLEYPYDGSDKLGRISVTLGDVDRLVPGEFLNDNIIDFYLRFLWRHLDSSQQQKMYFFTAHFFSQLNGTNGAHELSTTDPDERFTRVARWTHKETNLFEKRFLFIPINDSFHWSLAVFCNPGSAIIRKHRKVRRRCVITDDCRFDPRKLVDLVSGNGGSIGGDGSSVAQVSDGSLIDEKIEEEEVKSFQEKRLANPPCLLFLDSLRCHRKKKFTKMLRNYLECEYKARFASSSASNVSEPKTVNDGMDEQETVVTAFDLDSIGLLEPNIPLQSNNSDCGVFLLMYAVSIVRRFPSGVTREDLESNLTSTLTPNMFCDEHVLEFREYLQQLLFCLQFLERHGLPEQNVREEGLEYFAIDK